MSFSTPASSRAVAPRPGNLNAELPFDARLIDAVVVSHAHIDHTGRLPLLVKQGYHNPIIATPATRDLSAVMLPDSAHIQESDFDFLKRHGRVVPRPSRSTTWPTPLRCRTSSRRSPTTGRTTSASTSSPPIMDAGHILGSASVDIRITEGDGHRLVFSGDIGRNDLPIIRDPVPPVRRHRYPHHREHLRQPGPRFGGGCRRTAGRNRAPCRRARRQGARFRPLPSAAPRNWCTPSTRSGSPARFPGVPIYIDSPLAVNATEVFRLHPEIFDQREQLIERTQVALRFPAGASTCAMSGNPRHSTP